MRVLRFALCVASDLCWMGDKKNAFRTCPNENENSSHVVQSQGGRRIVIRRITAISSPTVEDPLIVQVFHFAACRWMKSECERLATKIQ